MSDTELLHEPKTEPVRRLEVFTGAGRRRSWSAEQKARIVAESQAGGVTVSAVARRHGLTAQQLFAWRRQSEAGRPEVLFAPVVVAAKGTQPVRQDALPPMIEVAIGGLIVRVPKGADLATLQTVLHAVGAAS